MEGRTLHKADMDCIVRASGTDGVSTIGAVVMRTARGGSQGKVVRTPCLRIMGRCSRRCTRIKGLHYTRPITRGKCQTRDFTSSRPFEL